MSEQKKSFLTMPVFERLSMTETVSSAQKRVQNRQGQTTISAYDKGKATAIARTTMSNTKTPTKAKKKKQQDIRTSTMKKIEATTPSKIEKNKQQDNVETLTDSMEKVTMEKAKNIDSPITPQKSTKEIIHKSSRNMVRLRCSSKYSPERGFSDLSPGALNLSQILINYMDGAATQSQVAKAIIEALWDRDFMPGKRWSIDCATVEQLEEEGVYAVEKEATWDWKDIYAVSSSKGTIRFRDDLKEIRIESYSHYCAG